VIDRAETLPPERSLAQEATLLELAGGHIGKSKGEWFRARREAAAVIEGWRHHYNQVRPHSSLNYLTLVQGVSQERVPGAGRCAARSGERRPHGHALVRADLAVLDDINGIALSKRESEKPLTGHETSRIQHPTIVRDILTPSLSPGKEREPEASIAATQLPTPVSVPERGVG